MSDLVADDLDFGRSDPPARPTRPEAASDAGASPKAPAASVAGERTITPVAGRFGLGKGGKGLALVGLLAGCGVFLAATGSHPRAHKPKTAPDEPARQVVDFSSVRASPSTIVPKSAGAGGPAFPTLAAPGADAPSLTGPGSSPAVGGAAASLSSAGAAQAGTAGDSASLAAQTPAQQAAAQQAAAQQTAAEQAHLAQLQAIRGAPLLAYTAEARGGAVDATAAAPLAIGRTDAPASELDQLRRGSTIGLVHAERLPDRNFLLTAGALLPCTLETAMDTSAPGFVTCRIAKDVYSDNGAVILMEKGSRVIGEYRSGFQQGRARIFVLWDRITTPGGVAVDVSSPASDALGRAGFDGSIDSHFWQRFGGALLLTTISGGLNAAAESNARYASVVQAPQEAAGIALENSINIPPTLRKPQGSDVAIFVSRDLDFSRVYSLKPR